LEVLGRRRVDRLLHWLLLAVGLLLGLTVGSFCRLVA
jgi:hypothetical protein